MVFNMMHNKKYNKNAYTLDKNDLKLCDEIMNEVVEDNHNWQHPYMGSQMMNDLKMEQSSVKRKLTMGIN